MNQQRYLLQIIEKGYLNVVFFYFDKAPKNHKFAML